MAIRITDPDTRIRIATLVRRPLTDVYVYTVSVLLVVNILITFVSTNILELLLLYTLSCWKQQCAGALV